MLRPYLQACNGSTMPEWRIDMVLADGEFKGVRN
jgi:hypothetical protein